MMFRVLASTLLAAMLCVSPAFAAEGKTKVLFIAGHASHAPGDHEHRAGCMLLAKKLMVETDEEQFRRIGNFSRV